MKKYADPPMDLADASLVIFAEQLDGRILSTDLRDFKTYRSSAPLAGRKNHYPFQNLLLPE